MFKKCLGFAALCCYSLAHAAVVIGPTTLDFGRDGAQQVPGYDEFEWESVVTACNPFNYALELVPYFDYLKKRYNITAAVETGTWKGETTKCFGLLFDEVHTAELDVDTFQDALTTLQDFPNVDVHFGNSPDILRQILPALAEQRTLFYLDAHWQSEWPLKEELKCIAKTHYNNCIIVIDDFKVPGRSDIPYDSYDIHECSYEYVKRGLDRIFSAYEYFYIIPESVNSKAKLVVIPQKWEKTAE